MFFLTFWLIVSLDKLWTKKGLKQVETKKLYYSNKKDYPLVSIVIPAYNEEERVTKTLDSVISLDYPLSKLEIIRRNMDCWVN